MNTKGMYRGEQRAMEILNADIDSQIAKEVIQSN